MILSISFSAMVENIFNLALGYPIMSLATLMPLLLILMVRIKKIPLQRELNFVYWFCVFFFVSDLPLWITTGLKINNQTYFYIRELINHLLIIGFYYFIIGLKRTKKIIVATEIILSILGLSSFLFFTEIPNQLTTIYKAVIIVLIFVHFNYIIKDLKIKQISDYPYFWISSGILIFSSGSILIFLFFTFTFELRPQFKIYSQFLDVLVILMFIFIGIGFTKETPLYPS